MISGEEIGELIKLPYSVDKDQLIEIEALIEKYPYCSGLYIIHLIGLLTHNDISFERKLKRAAAHVSDREYLFHLVNDNERHINLISEEKAAEEDVVKQEVSEKEMELLATDEEKEVSDLNESILSHIIETTFSPEVEEDFYSDTDKEEELVVQDGPGGADAVPPIEMRLDRPKNMSFIQWLKYKQAIIDSSVKPKDSLNSDEGIMSKRQINALLDKFIEEEPSMPPVNKGFTDSTIDAKKSLNESLDITSETLAKIHVMQGNYSKAISAYKQLSLLYPEKKVFFASQIKKIKDKRNT